MVDNEPAYDQSDVVRFEFLETVSRHRRILIAVPLATAAFVFAVAGTWILWLQPSERVYRLPFSVTFEGAARGTYPNGQPFSSSDIIAPSVVDEVFAANEIGQHCSNTAFQNGLSVSPVAGQAQDAVLEFIVPSACRALPPATASKALLDALRIWAVQSAVRGASGSQTGMVTPATFDAALSGSWPPLVGAHEIRRVLSSLLDEVARVERQPGAARARAGDPEITLTDVRLQLRNLIETRLQPLISMARSQAESTDWVRHAIERAEQTHAGAEAAVEARRRTLHAYASATGDYASVLERAIAIVQRPDLPAPSGSLTPGEMARLFAARLVEMSAPDTAFRQQLTQALQQAEAEAVRAASDVLYYQRLAATLQRSGGLPIEVFRARLQEIAGDAKALARRFEELHEVWVRLAFSSQAEAYRAGGPVAIVTSQSYRVSTLIILVVAGFVLAMMTTALVVLTRERYLEWRIHTRNH